MTARTIDLKRRVELFKARIDACDALLDYLHDDVAWKDQQPMRDMLFTMRGRFEDELFEGLEVVNDCDN